MNKIRIVLVDDHQMLIDGLKAILSTFENIEIVKTYTNGNQLLNEFESLKIDLILTDISMPQIDGYELTKQIKKIKADTKVIAVSMSGDIANINRMLDAGISGYVLKNAGNAELLEAIEKVASGKMHFSDDVTEEMVKSSKEKDKKPSEKISLSEREIEILKLIAQEHNNAQIGDILFISERTVETHRKNMMRKMNFKTMIGLVKYAMDNKLI
ncbi:MAG: response regulator transcription factor [Saprospirales bacterium]|jgi:DNA-binding NarL/FixJ family response regulator|nr:response regulator transcription factor [Saprospirales bacterium]